jgi:hypothetical protein
LFEVSLSLVLVSVGVVSVAMLIPGGVKTQLMARYQVLASAKALELVEAYNASHNANPAIDVEAPHAWNVHVSYKSQAPDLESRLSSYRFGLLPLPTTIAKRLDSDGELIHRILSEGGQLYYSQPLVTTGFKENAVRAQGSPPNESQRLIVGIVGYPQNNMIWALPQKAWPYYTPYPSPPAHIKEPNTNAFLRFDFPGALGRGYVWEQANLDDADMTPVWNAYAAYQNADTPDVALAQAYLQAAYTWCTSKSIPLRALDGTTRLTDFATTDVTRRYLEVTGLRFLAHAAACRFRFGAGSVGALNLTSESLRVLHDNCLFVGMRFQASYPYDWGCPRPLQRAIMMDFPLIEYDLGSAPLTGGVSGTALQASQWRPVAPQAIRNVGRSYSFPAPPPDAPSLTSIWGPTSHATLPVQFEPADRCRQLVFWAVDWQSYEDCETAPSAVPDASRYPIGSVGGIDGRQGRPGFMDWQQFGYRNPEKTIVFMSDMRSVSTGTATPDTGDETRPSTAGNDNGAGVKDQGLRSPQRERFLGLWGADRNCNQQLDRGTVPPSVRLRAIEVARYNFYDLRVPAVIR